MKIPIGKIIRKAWSEIKKGALEYISTVVFYIIYFAFVAGLMGYIIYVLVYEPTKDVAFQMATISGILGGLVLSGGLIRGDLPPVGNTNNRL